MPAAETLGADELMMRNYTAMAQRERELISKRLQALSIATAHGTELGDDGEHQPLVPPCLAAADMSRAERADQTAHHLRFEIDRLSGGYDGHGQWCR